MEKQNVRGRNPPKNNAMQYGKTLSFSYGELI